MGQRGNFSTIIRSMPYQQLLERLYKINIQKKMRLGLNQMRSLSKAVGFPEKNFQAIHIAGSNGKGSVATKIAKGLQLSGLQVGLFTSPHISTFRERIRINGKMISVLDVERILNRIIDLPGTFFELTTLMAFLYFSDKKVDIAVVETGLGGRLDATNILTPELSVITSISLEHTEFLGSTLEEIAREKAGIIKPGVPVVLGPKASIISAPDSIQVFGLFKSIEEENGAIARSSLELLKIPEHVILTALNTKPPCRMETVNNVILDVAHNPDAFTRYFKEDQRRPLHIVCALSKNKDLDSCLAIIARHASYIYLVDPPNDRSASPEDLRKILSIKGYPDSQMESGATIADAIQLSTFRGSTAVIGSFFIMSHARKALGIHEPIDAFEINES